MSRVNPPKRFHGTIEVIGTYAEGVAIAELILIDPILIDPILIDLIDSDDLDDPDRIDATFTGTARCNPEDTEVPEVGISLALSRAFARAAKAFGKQANDSAHSRVWPSQKDTPVQPKPSITVRYHIENAGGGGSNLGEKVRQAGRRKRVSK